MSLRIVMRSMGGACGQNKAQTACPASWVASTVCSAAVMFGRSIHSVSAGSTPLAIRALADAQAGDGAAQRIQVIAAVACAGRGARYKFPGALDAIVQRFGRKIQPHFAIVDFEDFAPVLNIRVRDVQVKL